VQRSERDSQRSKVYAAETEVYDWHPDQNRPEPFFSIHGQKPWTIEECQQWVNHITSSKWWQEKYGRGWHITVKRGRGGGWSYGGRLGHITLGVRCRRKWIILHELAHNITHDTCGWWTAAHGWQFCYHYLELVSHYIGRAEHDALKAAFKARRVKFRAPRKRNLTDEQRAELRDRLARARAAKEVKVP
jgi:putative metallohydrolase (TIGR04338 family)